MRRLQPLAAVLAVVLAAGGAAYADREVEPASFAASPAERVPSGAWYCPHGGGDEGWQVALQIANPGDEPATVRIRSVGVERTEAAVDRTIEPGTMAVVPVDATGRERSSTVEWFGQWVAVGWLSHAGGDEGGVAAEPCTTRATGRWLLPDATSATDADDDYVLVMNPTARDAVVSFTLLSERKEPIQKSELTDVVLKPSHSTVVRVSDVVKGEDTVGTLVEAATGRVVAATLGISKNGGIRSTLGYAGDPSTQLVFPGGEDAGRTQLAVMSTGEERVELAAEVLGAEPESEQAFAGVADAAPPSRSARTFATTTTEPSSVVFSAAAPGVAAVRRTFGVVSDQASTIGGTPASAWLVLPAVSGTPNHPGIALANPSDAPADVVLAPLGGADEQATVTVPPRSSILAPEAFARAHAGEAVVAVAERGTFVPVSASYSRGRDGFATFAVALGIPVPEEWASS